MSKMMHLSFEIEGPVTNEHLAQQAIRMGNFLVDNGLVTDLLACLGNDEAALGAYSCYVSEDWTEDWPTEPGYYWFYGWGFRAFRGKRDRPPEMHFVRVHETTANSFGLVTGWHLRYRKGEMEGHWMPARAPEPPEQLKGDKDE